MAPTLDLDVVEMQADAALVPEVGASKAPRFQWPAAGHELVLLFSPVGYFL